MMKNLIVLILFIAGFAGVQAQSSGGETFTVDTITNGETLTFTYDANINGFADVFFHFAADSLSGTPSGTISYQSSNDGIEWHTESTDTLTNAAETDQSYKLTNFAGKRVRISVTSSGTQSVEVSPSIGWKRH